ncbi:hypothetical protein V8G54_030873 [Vigna mungo]|uniref:Nucleoporin Nup120/160 beta-propeller domain-containing protein n=1 Tax=Vigna mungo TaxID=3915 RepID=A0AAQ3MX98_VIGMU
MGTGSALAGKEVPVVGSDAVRWIDLHVPSSSNNVAVNGDDAPATTYDRASCFVVGDPPTYLIWRIHKALPHSLELLELAASKEFPRVGLRFTFPDVLCPFAFICKNEVTYFFTTFGYGLQFILLPLSFAQISGASRFPYLLYVLTVSGVGYLLRIRNISAYASISIVPVDELLEVNVRGYIANQAAAIAAVTATAGGLVVGTSDGSVFCFQLGVLDPGAPGFVHELRDEAGITRLWGLIPRGKMVGTVQELVILELHEKKFVFVLHLDGTLRIWDLASHSRVFSHNMGTTTMAGIGEESCGSHCLLILRRGGEKGGKVTLRRDIEERAVLDENLETISLCNIQYKIGDKIVFSMESSVQNIPLEELELNVTFPLAPDGRCLDVKLTLEKIWILKDDELVSHTFSTNTDDFGMTSSTGINFSLSTTPTITSAKLNWKNYLSWSSSVELWFLGQGYHDHLEQDVSTISDEEKSQWQKLDFQLCAVLWQSVEQEVLEIFRPYKTCSSFWKRAHDIFVNDVQHLFDATQRVTSLKQANHDMVAHLGKACAAIEELKNFFVADSLKGINKKLDEFYMVLILRSLHSDFDHVHDQILACDQVPTMDNLVTRLLRLPTLVKDENAIDGIETSAMVAPQGKGGGRRNRGHASCNIRPQCTYCKKIGHTQEKCYALHGYPDKAVHVSKFDNLESRISNEEYQKFLRYKFGKSSNLGQFSSTSNVPTVCISQSVEGHRPWILDLGASDHIFGNIPSFSSMCSSKIPHFIIFANGSKVASQGIGTIFLSP